MTLKLDNFSIKVKNFLILHGNICFKKGINAITGKNGSGKSSLLRTIAGDSQYKFSGSIFLDNKDITNMSPEDRFKAGIFMSFQETCIIDNVSVFQIIFESLKTRNSSIYGQQVLHTIKKYCALLDIDYQLLYNPMSSSLSGGERKKIEIIQMLMLGRYVYLLDELDAGLDITTKNILVKLISSLSGIVLLVSHNSDFLNSFKNLNKNYKILDNKINSE